MDFGGFILFILCALGLLIGVGYCVILFVKRSKKRWKGLGLLGIGFLMLAIFARLLYQTYWLDEAIYVAADMGDTAQVKSLLAKGASPNGTWEDGTTALAAAEKNNYKEIEAILQKAGGHD